MYLSSFLMIGSSYHIFSQSMRKWVKYKKNPQYARARKVEMRFPQTIWVIQFTETTFAVTDIGHDSFKGLFH